MELACPACRAAPPPHVPCDACEEEHDPFATAGACPRCALVWDALTCPSCERRALLEAWVPDGAARRAFLARLLGGDAPPDDPQAGPWTAAWRKAARAVTTEVTELFAPVDETTDPTPLRAAILDAEDALEAARRGERELIALAADANPALAPEVEAARKASRSAVESATRALEGARKDAEELHRRLLDRTRTPPVEPDALAPIEPNPVPAAACPSCAWRPDGYPRWQCHRCETRYDALTTNARCPGCARRFVQIACPICKAWSTVARWRQAGGVEPESSSVEEDAVEARPRSPIGRLTSQLAGILDRSDSRQEALAGALERTASTTDRALGEVTGWVASFQDDGVGAARFDQEDWRGAIDECTRTLRARPDHAVALAVRGGARFYLGDDRGARVDLDAALALEGMSVARRAWTLTKRARLNEATRDLAGVIADATAAIALVPSVREGHYFRALALFHLGRLDEALADLDAERLVASAESAAHVAAMRAMVQFARGQWEGCEADATVALEGGYPDARSMHTLRASCRVRLGRFDSARAEAVRALRLAPAEGDALVLRATLRASSGDVQGALADLARLRRHDPWGAKSDRVPLAFAAHLRGERDRAIQLLRLSRAHAAEPEYSASWLALLLGVDDPFPAPRPGWGGDLAGFVRGELPLDVLLERAAGPATTGKHTAEERACEAHCYAGLLAESQGRAAEAQASYRSCVDIGVSWFPESLWASLRLAGVTPRTAPPAPPPAVSNLADQLERLARLREQGILTPDEFALAKRRILGL